MVYLPHRTYTRRVLIFAFVALTGLLAPPAKALRAARQAAKQEAAPRAVQDAGALQKGKPVERELKGGETHSYRVALAAGQYVHAVVEQKGIDVVVVLF